MLVRLSVLLAAFVLGGCSMAQRGHDPSVPHPLWRTELRADPAEFPLSGHREVKVVYALVNTSKQTQRLDFPSAQRLEVTMRAPDGRQLFQWSEDRQFAAVASSVVVNPGERLEYEAGIPTRDMLAGRTYAVEAVLPGYTDTAASIRLLPQ